MASVSWDAKEILLNDYLQADETVTGEYYATLLDQIDEEVLEKRPGLQKKKNHLGQMCFCKIQIVILFPVSRCVASCDDEDDWTDHLLKRFSEKRIT